MGEGWMGVKSVIGKCGKNFPRGSNPLRKGRGR